MRSSVKVSERTDEETTAALHCGSEGRNSGAAFGGRSADLGSVRDELGLQTSGVLPLAEGVLREWCRGFPSSENGPTIRPN